MAGATERLNIYVLWDRGISINEGGKGPILVWYPGEFFYACLWLTPKLNWRIYWHYERGWGWR